MKKLILCVIAFFMMLSISWSAEIGQICTMLKGSDAIQKFENPYIPYRGVKVPEDKKVSVVGKITQDDFNFLKKKIPANDWNENWKNAFLVVFDNDFGKSGGGLQRLYILIRPQNLKDCK